MSSRLQPELVGDADLHDGVNGEWIQARKQRFRGF